jgi:hypothetical protein
MSPVLWVKRSSISVALCVSAALFSTVARCEVPEKISLCQLKQTPGAYNHKLIQVTDFVSHGFEDFTLFDPSCPDWPAVWLEYGGTSKSGTMYCCGVSGDQNRRPKELEVEKITVPLVEDGFFLEFDKSIHRAPDSIVHATIVGRFFAGKETRSSSGSWWRGYGHMGCCSLLAIQQILSIDPQDRDDLDYSASPDQPRMGKAGCGYRFLLPLMPYSDALHSQGLAEGVGREWVFEDPRRVAAESLSLVLREELTSIGELSQTRTAQGRVVYEWNPPNKNMSYMVVVSRPYWLSFYLRDVNKVAWVAIAAYECSCGESNSVIRVK